MHIVPTSKVCFSDFIQSSDCHLQEVWGSLATAASDWRTQFVLELMFPASWLPHQATALLSRCPLHLQWGSAPCQDAIAQNVMNRTVNSEVSEMMMLCQSADIQTGEVSRWCERPWRRLLGGELSGGTCPTCLLHSINTTQWPSGSSVTTSRLPVPGSTLSQVTLNPQGGNLAPPFGGGVGRASATQGES